MIFNPSVKSVTFFFNRLSDITLQKALAGFAAEFLESWSWKEGDKVPTPTLPLTVFIMNPQRAPLLPQNPTELSSAIPANAASTVLTLFINQVPALLPSERILIRPATSSL